MLRLFEQCFNLHIVIWFEVLLMVKTWKWKWRKTHYDIEYIKKRK